AQKGGYPHFMLKEIHESPEAVANAMRGRLTDDGTVTFREFTQSDDDLRKIHEVLLLGMGTSRHAALLGAVAIEDWSGMAARDADGAIYLHAGPEIGVASTKTFLSHLVSLYLLSLRLATVHGRISLERRQELVAALRSLPDQIRELLKREAEIAQLARRYS